MSEEEDLYSSSSDTEPTLDLQFCDRDKSSASGSLTNQDVALMLEMDTSMSETDPSEENQDRTSTTHRRSAKNRSDCSTSTSSSLACVENSSPFSSPLPMHMQMVNSTSPAANQAFRCGRSAEYRSNSSNSSSPTSLSDIRLARSRAGSTPPTRSCGQTFENHFVNGGETTPTRRSRPNFSGLRSGHSVAESISASSCESRPRSTPTTSRDRYRSATGEVIDDHNHPNDENESNHYITEKNTSPSSALTVNSEHPINPASAVSSTESGSVCKALQEITGLINSVAKRMDDIEGKLDEKAKSRKKVLKEKVPLSIKSEVRKTYKMMVESTENFSGFNLNPGIPYADPHNEMVASQILREVKLNNRLFPTNQIRAAIYTHYRSKCQEHSIRSKGIYDQRIKERRHCERLNRKLLERKSILEKANMPVKDKEKWTKVMKITMMSSEESDSDPNNDDIIVKPLQWRSAIVNRFLLKLDDKLMETKSPQARRQRKHRVTGSVSSEREVPKGAPKWAIVTETASQS